MSLSLSSEFEVLFCSKKGRREAIKREKLLGRINGDDLDATFYEFSLRSARSFDSSVACRAARFFLNVDYEKLGSVRIFSATSRTP